MELNLSSIILNIVAAIMFAVFFLLFSNKNKTKHEKIALASFMTLFYFIALMLKDYFSK
jgi:hypothetical protein